MLLWVLWVSMAANAETGFMGEGERFGNGDPVKKPPAAPAAKPSAPSAPLGAPRCEKGPTTNGKCLEELAKEVWDKVASQSFIKNCPQGCQIDVIPRSRWGGPEVKKVCTKEEAQYSQQLSDIKRRERVAYCAKMDDKSAAGLKNEYQAQTKKRKSPDCHSIDSPPSRIVLHHSGGPLKKGDGWTGAKDLYNYHTKPQPGGNGWTDIGYHFVIAKDEKGQWQAYEGRPKPTADQARNFGIPDRDAKCTWFKGSHVGYGANEGSLGIVIIGNYNGGEESRDNPAPLGPNPPQPGAVATLMKLVNKLKSECPTITSMETHGEARLKAFGCVKNGKADETVGRCREENIDGKNGGGCKTTCPGEGCRHLPGELHKTGAAT